MPFKEVNLTGGLNLQDSDLKKGFNEFEELDNLRHENGSLVKRYGVGISTAIATCSIDNMAIYVHRKLIGVKIADVNTNNLTFTSTTTLTIGGTINTTNIKIPGGSTDLTTIFKAGDTVLLSTSAVVSGGGACTNKDKPLVISSVTTNTIVFTTAVANETVNNNSSAGQSATISFVLGVSGASSPTNITIADSNSFDGRAFLTTFTHTNKELALINPLDYSDKIDLIDFGTGSDDMHIRPVAYTDAVRIACGLEHDPRIFKYINRHFFNGVYKTVANTNHPLLYPRWIFDTAVPVVTDNTFTLEKIANYDDLGPYTSRNVGSGVHLVKGNLDLNEDYTYKIVPVYDGTQEMPLSKNVITASTADAVKIPILKNKSALITREDGTIKIDIKVDTSQLNPRTSSLNVYRAKGTSGTYYKIKSIYLGDNDPNQKTATAAEHCKRFFFWKGGTDMSGGSANARTSLNGKALMCNGVEKVFNNNVGSNNYESKGWRKQLVTSDYNNFLSGTEFSQHEMGVGLSTAFNKDCVDTGPVFAGDDSTSGGSQDGGWYIAEPLEYAKENVTYYGDGSDDGDNWALDDVTPGGDYDGGMEHDTPNYNTGTPYGDSGSVSATDDARGLDYRFVNPGDTKNTAGSLFGLHKGDDASHGNWNNTTNEGSLDTKTLIISGWVKATGINHRDAWWKVYITKDYSDSEPRNSFDSSTGNVLLAQGKGGIENQNCGWTYFQREFTVDGTDLFMYNWMHTPAEWSNSLDIEDANVQIWGISIKEKITGYGLEDNLTSGFIGGNVLFAKNGEFDEFPNGVLKGNLIQNHDEHTYPIHFRSDRRTILDNCGPFVRTEANVPEAVSTIATDDYSFSTSNYQIKVGDSSDATNDNTSNDAIIEFIDTGLPDGARSPMETATSTDVKFKYATMLNGRQFVGNVKIIDDKDAEEYPNFIMFSEPNTPDIIPTTNYIQLQDLQGGEIVGIESIMGGIVVFMTNGIFRLNVPSSNPTNWSLVESHPNIGCLHDKVICKVPNGIFVATRDDIIFLDSGFSATPITQKIRTTYQTQASANPNTLRLSFDVKYNRLRLLYSNTTNSVDTVFYLYDISRGVWTQETHTGEQYDEIFSKDTNENILVEVQSSSTLRDLENTSYWRDANATAIAISMKTGDEALAPFDTKARVRRVNTSVVAATTAADLTLSMDGSSAHTSSNLLNGQQSTRPYTLNAGSKTQIQISDDSDQNVKIEKVEVEYE
tara:strand:+ start:889 stop:4581 length:3693 start_codon:yes stop_codon:yes gene_type:complete